MLCEGRNRASRSGLNSQEKPYKIGCLMPVKKLDTNWNDDMNENKKNADQKLQEYSGIRKTAKNLHVGRQFR